MRNITIAFMLILFGCAANEYPQEAVMLKKTGRVSTETMQKMEQSPTVNFPTGCNGPYETKGYSCRRVSRY